MLRRVYSVLAMLLRAEVKTKQVLMAALLFLTVDLFIFYFAFSDAGLNTNVLASGVLWLIYTYIVTMAVSNLYQKLQQNMFLQGLMMSGCGPSTFFIALTLFAVLLTAVLTFAMFLLFSLFFQWGLGWGQARVFLIFFMSSFGFCASGILVSELVSSVRLKELVLPVVYFPMVIPLLMASIKASTQNMNALDHRTLIFLLGINLILFFSSLLLYDFAKEELV